MRGRVIVALALVAVGLVWVGQGTGLLRGASFMVDEPLWAVVGAIAVLAGVGLAVTARLGRRGL